MITRIEIDGFKTFDHFDLDLRPLTAIVGPNASGKSNLFDAVRFLSLLAQHDIFTAMQDLRGLPEELFRRTAEGSRTRMKFAIEVLLEQRGIDTFGTRYELSSQRIRYELTLRMVSRGGVPRGVVISQETCFPIAKREDRALGWMPLTVSYNSRANPFIRLSENRSAIEIRQDGPLKRGKPVSLPIGDSTRTALSTINTAEFPHLYALKSYLSSVRFLELNPRAARTPNDRFEERVLRSDASNLSAVLARLKEETGTEKKPDGALADISSDLAALIPSVKKVDVKNDIVNRQFSFSVDFHDKNSFSSRLISDGTLRLLALLTLLNDPDRRGTLCFEEPENGVHEGRMEMLVQVLREAASLEPQRRQGLFQIILATHSPAVMRQLMDDEIVAADLVSDVDPKTKQSVKRTRMRAGVVPSPDLYDPNHYLTRAEIERLLHRAADAA